MTNIIAEMLKENTGNHFLDSGDIYGRNYERNKDRDFDKENPVTLKFSMYGNNKIEINFSYNIYHWLNERVSFNEHFDNLFSEFSKDRDESWLELMEEFPEWLNDNGFETSDATTANSYNHQGLLSQVIQYNVFTVNGYMIVSLQIHGGCDVRGGYTKPRIFKTSEDIFSDSFGTIECSGNNYLDGGEHSEENHYWSTDDAYHFYYNGDGDGKQLESYEGVAFEDGMMWEPGKLFIKDGNGYCPHCGALLVGR